MIVARFCQIHGGIEYAMPMVRASFKKAEADFASPTKAGLVRVVDRLCAVTESFKGQDVAKRERNAYKKVLRNIG